MVGGNGFTFEKKTLPTEAQWEYMAGGGKNKYPWGNQEPKLSMANYAESCEPVELKRASTPVDAFPNSVSHCGCWDVAGNLNEWCLDNSSPNYEWDLNHLNPIFVNSEKDDHIVRGGSGLHDEDCLRCASRDFYPPTLRDNIVGFRCVLNMVRKNG